MEAFVINGDDLFTAHKPGCAHLRMATIAFAIRAEPTREAIRRELDEEGFEDSDLAFAPCLGYLK